MKKWKLVVLGLLAAGLAQAALFTAKVAVPDGTTSAIVYITNYPVSIRVIPSGGASGKAQFSTSTPADLQAGTGVFDDWSKGTVSANTAVASEGPITAMRFVSVSGAITGEVVQ